MATPSENNDAGRLILTNATPYEWKKSLNKPKGMKVWAFPAEVAPGASVVCRVAFAGGDGAHGQASYQVRKWFAGGPLSRRYEVSTEAQEDMEEYGNMAGVFWTVSMPRLDYAPGDFLAPNSVQHYAWPLSRTVSLCVRVRRVRVRVRVRVRACCIPARVICLCFLLCSSAAR